MRVSIYCDIINPMVNELKISKIELLNGIEYSTIFSNMPTDKECFIDDVIYNTKNVKNDILFVCLKGANFDSHDEKVIADVINDGAKIVVVERDVDLDKIKSELKNNKEYEIIKVDNTRKALSLLSINYFREPLKKLTLIGITGTKGKTTTTYMIKRILEKAGHKVGIIGTIGYVNGDELIKTDNTTPESYLLQKYFYDMTKSNIEYAVIEVSSQSLKLYRTYGMHFDYAIFTNIAEDHIGKNEHKDFDEYFSCKLKIFDNCDIAIINKDDEQYDNILKYIEKTKIKKVISYSAKDIEKNIIEKDDLLGVEFKTKDFSQSIIIPLPGLHNIYNALSAITVTREIGIKEEIIIEALREISVPGRVEIIEKNKDYTIMVDYAHNELGTKMLIQSIKEYKPKRIVVVFGCGGNRDVNRRYGMGEVVGEYADYSIVTADNSRFEKTSDIIKDILSRLTKWTNNYIVIEDRREAIIHAIKHHEKGDIILVIGKGHEDYNDFNGVKTHFSDKEEILKVLNGKQ